MPSTPRPLPVPMLRLFTLGHVIGFAAFLGGTLGILMLVAAGEVGGTHREFAIQVALRLRTGLLIPGMMTMLLSGILLSSLGPWGFVKYRWVAGKLALTAILILHNHHSFHPLLERLFSLALQGAGPGAPDYGEALGSFMRVGIIQALLLVVLASLSIFKPGGRLRAAPSAQ